jgi:hypothetical protein
MDGDWYASECDRASFAIMPRGRDADCATLEYIDTQNAEVALHHTLEATRASAHLLAVLCCATGVLASGLDIGQSLSEQ